jgi:hypothetical protein
MAQNLYRPAWGALDPFELRLLLDERIGGTGQYDAKKGGAKALYIPEAGPRCRAELRFPKDRLAGIRRGPAFDQAEWDGIASEVETKLLNGVPKFGRDISFSRDRVEGSWRGVQSGVQILQLADPPQLQWHAAQNPFILEFPIIESEFWPATNYRRRRTHRRLTLLLNLLLAGRIQLQPRQREPVWVLDMTTDPTGNAFMQAGYLSHLDAIVLGAPSPAVSPSIQEVEPTEYYTWKGNVGGPLRVPSILDETLAGYLGLPEPLRARFDRSLFWLDMSQRQWNVSMSASFAALVTAIEVLLDRGETHTVECAQCGRKVDHDHPSIGANLKAFFDAYAPGDDRRSSASMVYASRSSISHGNDLMQLDQDLVRGWDPPWWNQRQLHDDLSGLTTLALRNWLAAQIAGEL